MLAPLSVPLPDEKLGALGAELQVILPNMTASDFGPPVDYRGGGLPSDVRRALQSIGRPSSFPAGAVLMRDGQEPDRVYLIESGVVKVTWITPNGTEVVLGFRGEGELLGELSALDLESTSATATALGDVLTHVISSAAFTRHLEDDPGAAVAIVRFLSRRFRDADRKLIEFGSFDSLGRVASRLLELASGYGEPGDRGTTIAVPISQEELAAWAGCSRKAAVNALRILREAQAIDTQRRQITVLKPETLRRLTTM
jgi:CRP/FNR family cyclic AMP-dependent transcriptional regulator